MIYTKLPKYCKTMTKEELYVYFPPGMDTRIRSQGKNKGQEYQVPKHYTQAFLFRSLIMNELEYCDSSEIRTLRGVWYSAIKPTLDKLGLLEEKDQQEDELRRWDAVLSNYVCDLLRKGMLTFSDLGINDISRKKENPFEKYYTVDSKVFGYKGNVTPYPNILIATEKDTVYSVISKIATLYGASCISCKGQNSLGAMESIIKGMFYSQKISEEPIYFDTIYILTMTDYDPAGYYIAEALEGQVNDILTAIGKDNIRVETHRIGITPDQLSEEQVSQNMYSPKKANIGKWMERTNGINGQQKGLELDALSNNQIREIFVENLKSFVEVDTYKKFIKKSYIKLKALDFIKEKFTEAVKIVTEEMIDEMKLLDFDIHEIAKKGSMFLDIEDLCDNENDDRINDLMERYL